MVYIVSPKYIVSIKINNEYSSKKLHALPSSNYSFLNYLNTLNYWFLQNNLILNMSKTSLIN